MAAVGRGRLFEEGDFLNISVKRGRLFEENTVTLFSIHRIASPQPFPWPHPAAVNFAGTTLLQSTLG